MKHFRKITAVAAAAVLAVPLSLGVLAGCGGDSGNGNISVYINCNDADATAYQNLIDAWEVEYANKLKAADPETYGADFTVTVDFTPQSDADQYIGDAKRWLQSGTAQDILYVSPGMVQMYVNNGYIADLSDKLDYEQYNIGDLWGGALGRYAYNTSDGSIGLPVEYDQSTGAFYQNGDKSKKVGVYALPKDYSSFSYAYNANFFTKEFTDAYKNQVDTQGAVYEYGSVKAGEKPWESATAKASPVINIGTTVTYFPFNFYNYHTLEAAYNAGDPVAIMSVNNGGYDVTLPGYPNQTFTNGTDSADTHYDDSIGYMVYTYSEFSALSFAVSYYVTVYDTGRTDKNSDGVVETDDYKAVNERFNLASWLNGQSIFGVYANDQYDREPYYLTSWLAGNDVSIINSEYNSVVAPEGEEATSDYGINSTKFMEAFSAFLAYGSDWVGNMYFSNSQLDQSVTDQGGFQGLTMGFNVFYGYGTWDSSNLDTDKSKLDFQVMPTPVSDDYSLYTRYKDMNYEAATAGTSNSGGTFNETQINENLAARQDQWAARMDSVGFGVNANVERKYTGSNAWKRDAVYDLCAYLTIEPSAQVNLTYAGSQIPNYISQSADYLNREGDFAAMVTPDDKDTWDTYYPVAKAIADASTNPFVAGTKVSDWLTNNNYGDFVDDIVDSYADSTLGNVNGSMSYAFRMFRMVSLNRNSRNLLLRMAETNGVQDPCTYTYDKVWWQQTFMTYEGNYLFYTNIEDGGYESFSKDPIGTLSASGFNPTTPYNYCQAIVLYAQARLQESLMNLM